MNAASQQLNPPRLEALTAAAGTSHLLARMCRPARAAWARLRRTEAGEGVISAAMTARF